MVEETFIVEYNQIVLLGSVTLRKDGLFFHITIQLNDFFSATLKQDILTILMHKALALPKQIIE